MSQSSANLNSQYQICLKVGLTWTVNIKYVSKYLSTFIW